MSPKRSFSSLILIIFLLAACGLAYFYYHKYTEISIDPNAETQKQVQDVVARVGKLIELPPSETPTLAMVTNAEAMKDQQFFADAQDGDQLLAFMQSGEAILYRPSTNKIIKVAPIVINSGATNAPQAPAAPAAAASASTTASGAKK
jgi:hypothetical protein